jgi:transcriptional regulator with XRE-family HTH domain
MDLSPHNEYVYRSMNANKQNPVCRELASIRNELGLSMEKMAAKLGYKTASGYQHYEKDYKKPYFENSFLRKLLKHLVPLGIEEERIIALGGVKDKETSAPLSDAEVALTDALKVMIQIILHNGLASQRSFIAAFDSMEADYQGMPNAALVMQELISFVGGTPLDPDRPNRESIQKLLRLPQIGRA